MSAAFGTIAKRSAGLRRRFATDGRRGNGQMRKLSVEPSGLLASFEAWRATAPADLLTRVWPLAWLASETKQDVFVLPKPPREILDAPTPDVPDTEVIEAMVALGLPRDRAKRFGRTPKVAPVKARRWGSGYRKGESSGTDLGDKSPRVNAGINYYERYYFALPTQRARRGGGGE